jgi:hypothetical protein
MAFDLPAPCSSDAAFRVLLPARDNAGHDRPAGPA